MSYSQTHTIMVFCLLEKKREEFSSVIFQCVCVKFVDLSTHNINEHLCPTNNNDFTDCSKGLKTLLLPLCVSVWDLNSDVQELTDLNKCAAEKFDIL